MVQIACTLQLILAPSCTTIVAVQLSPLSQEYWTLFSSKTILSAASVPVASTIYCCSPLPFQLSFAAVQVSDVILRFLGVSQSGVCIFKPDDGHCWQYTLLHKRSNEI